MAVERLPFELAKPSANEYVTQSSQIGHNGEPLDEVLEGLDNISKQSTQSEEQALVFETDGGVQVGKIDANGADFVNLKRGGQQVARMSDLPTKDTSIGDTPSTTHVPTTKAVKDYVDAHSGGDYPIDTETTSSEDEEQVWGNDEGTQEYAKIGSYGMKSKAYLDMQGDSIIDDEIGDTPSTTHAPSAKAVKDYIYEHGSGNLPISRETTQSEDEESVFSNDAGTDTYVMVGPYGIKAKAYFDLYGNPIGGGSASDVFYAELGGKKWSVLGDSLSAESTLGAGVKTYHDYISEKYSMVKTNYAVGGQGYMTGQSNFIAQAGLVQSDAEIVTIFGSFNDWANANGHIGTLGDTTNETLYGAVYSAINTVITRAPHAKIGIILPTVWSQYCWTNGTAYYRSTSGPAFLNAIKETAQEIFGLPVLDLYHNSGLRPWEADFKTDFYKNADGVHPNTLGHKMYIAPQVEAFIKSLFMKY